MSLSVWNWGWSGNNPVSWSFWGWQDITTDISTATLSMKGAHFYRSNLTVEARQQAFGRKGKLATEIKVRDGAAAFQKKGDRLHNVRLGRL